MQIHLLPHLDNILRLWPISSIHKIREREIRWYQKTIIYIMHIMGLSFASFSLSSSYSWHQCCRLRKVVDLAALFDFLFLLQKKSSSPLSLSVFTQSHVCSTHSTLHLHSRSLDNTRRPRTIVWQIIIFYLCKPSVFFLFTRIRTVFCVETDMKWIFFGINFNLVLVTFAHQWLRHIFHTFIYLHRATTPKSYLKFPSTDFDPFKVMNRFFRDDIFFL